MHEIINKVVTDQKHNKYKTIQRDVDTVWYMTA